MMVFVFDNEKASAYANVVHLNACGTLSTANTTYILDNDVSSTGTCFTINANNVEFNLNGKTITYDTFAGAGFPDKGFEGGSGDQLDASWTVYQPTQSTMKRRSNSEALAVDSWHLSWGSAENGSSITSPWINLPINSGTANNATTYFVRSDLSWAYSPTVLFNMKIEYKDASENISTVKSTDFSSTQRFDFATKQTPGQYRAIITLINDAGIDTNSYGQVPTFDEFNMVPLQKNGIYCKYFRSNISIVNKNPDTGEDIVMHEGETIRGSIRQGGASSFQGYSMDFDDVDNLTISNIYVDSTGFEASSIYVNNSTYVTLEKNEINSHNKNRHNRSTLMAAVVVGNGNNYNINHNKIYAGSGWGALSISGTDQSDISFNELHTSTSITNHFTLVGSTNDNTKIHDNIINANPGQGISTGGRNCQIYNNTITLNGQKPNIEYNGYIEFDAIKLNDYDDPDIAISDSYIHDNVINLTGRITDRGFTPDPGPGPLPENINLNTIYKAIMNGISNIATRGNIRYSNNIITARSIDKEVKVVGISPGVIGTSTFYETVFDHNVIDSDMANIEFGGYAGQGQAIGNLKFYSNTFIKGASANEYYHTIGMSRTGDITRDLMRFIDTKLQNGASMTDVDLKTDYGRFSYWVDWYLNVNVKDNSLNPVENAHVVVKDKNNLTVFDGNSGADGKTGRITIDQLQHIGSGILNTSNVTQFSPHTITVTYPDASQKTEIVTMDTSKNVTFIKDASTQLAVAELVATGTDAIAPTFNNVTPAPGNIAWDQNSFTFSIKSSEVATCRYATTAGTSFAAMTNQFETADGLSQTKDMTLARGVTHNFYVHCQDASGNTSLDPYQVTYAVGSAPVVDGIAPAAPIGLNVN